MTRTLQKLLLGLGAGFAGGYAAVRTWEAVREWRAPAPPLEKDASAYARTRRRLEVAETVRSIAASVAFAYGPAGETFDEATLDAPAWLRPACLIAPAALASALFDLPVSFVQEYALERRYGLSEQPRASWLLDYAKSTAVSTGLTVLVASLFGVAVRHAPRWWPLVAALGAFPLLVLGNVIVPLYVMPLFNEFVPVTGSLEQRLRALASRYGVGDADILRMNMSKQTRKANAFVTGIGNTHRIVLGDTLIDHFPEDEIEFVVAHELGHYVSRDTWRFTFAGEALSALLFVIAYCSASENERERLRKRALLLVRFYTVMMVATQALRPFLFGFSRSREWAADRFALETTGDARAGASAFRRLRDQNLAEEDPPAWYEFFFSSHPSLKRRIAALERASEMPAQAESPENLARS